MSEGKSKGKRIDFASADAARFNELRDQWRGAAASYDLPRAGLRVATVLPGYISREYGYAFPTDEQLAKDITTTFRTVNRGLKALEDAKLIERQEIPKRNEAGKLIGRLRRIHFTLPEPNGQDAPNGQNTERTTPSPNGQKQSTERTYVCPNILDIYTPDKKQAPKVTELGVYVAPARENAPSPYRGDDDFLDRFDQTLIEMTDGVTIGAGELEGIIQAAFDRATKSSDMFMPFYWYDICALRDNRAEQWFRRRAGQLLFRQAA